MKQKGRGAILGIHPVQGVEEVNQESRASSSAEAQFHEELKEAEKRISWNEYFFQVASLIAQRSSCRKLSVGTVLVMDRQIIATGYNGAPAGMPTCLEMGHELDEQGHCVRTIHSELNAVLQCSKTGTDTSGSIAYVTHSPCRACTLMLRQAGVSEVFFDQDHKGGSEFLASVFGRGRVHKRATSA